MPGRESCDANGPGTCPTAMAKSRAAPALSPVWRSARARARVATFALQIAPRNASPESASATASSALPLASDTAERYDHVADFRMLQMYAHRDVGTLSANLPGGRAHGPLANC